MIKPEDWDKKAAQKSLDAINKSMAERRAAEESMKPKSKIIRRGLSDTRRKKLSIRNRRRKNKK